MSTILFRIIVAVILSAIFCYCFFIHKWWPADNPKGKKILLVAFLLYLAFPIQLLVYLLFRLIPGTWKASFGLSLYSFSRMAALISLILGSTILAGLLFYLLFRLLRRGKLTHPAAKGEKEKPAYLQISKLKVNKKLTFATVALVGLILLVIAGFSLFKPKGPKPIATFDKYPIWMLRDGKVAVYREMTVYSDSIEKRLVITNLSSEPQEKVKIYEAIPKEIAGSASALVLEGNPQIIENDPVIMWEGDPSQNVNMSWRARNTVQTLQSTKTSSASSPFLGRFEEQWPMFGQNQSLKFWEDMASFSEKETKKSAKAAAAGKTITISKDVVDIFSTLATGSGLLDAMGVLSELHSIGTTLYDAETPAAIENANMWLTIIGVAKGGYENQDLIKSTMNTGIAALKAKQGSQAAATAAKLSQTADSVSDVSEGVSAAESAGINLAGIIVDYAVVNDVASTAKYNIFEMNEQAKMAYISKNLVDLWKLRKEDKLTEADSKKIVELEILFFIAQQDELRVRQEYFKSQTGVLDSIFSVIPGVGQYSAKSGIKEIDDTMKLSKNYLAWRMGARERIYREPDELPSPLQSLTDLENKEKDILEKVAQVQQTIEPITKVVETGTTDYDNIRKSAKKLIKEEKKSAKKSPTLILMQETPTQAPQNLQPSQTTDTQIPSSGTTGFNFSLNNLPQSLLGFPLSKTRTTPYEDDVCLKQTSPLGYLNGSYTKGEEAIEVTVIDYGDTNKAASIPQIGADCMSQTTGATFSVDAQDPVSGYPLSFVAVQTEAGYTIGGSFSAVGKYTIIVTMLVEAGNGGQASDHRQAMAEIIRAFLKEGSETPVSAPPPSQSGTCQDLDLGQNYTTYYYYDSTFPCMDYSRSATSSQFSVRCNDAVSRWRELYVKSISTQGASSLRIKADLDLDEHLGFFIESGGVGVKYDDYVNLLALSSDPSSTLSNECNTSYTSSTVSSCSIQNSSSSVVSHCGVPKYTASQSCDFTVNTSGINTVYLVFSVADAWPADVEGILSNVQICR